MSRFLFNTHGPIFTNCHMERLFCNGRYYFMRNAMTIVSVVWYQDVTQEIKGGAMVARNICCLRMNETVE